MIKLICTDNFIIFKLCVISKEKLLNNTKIKVMTISGNFLDRLVVKILPKGIFLGLISAAFAKDKLDTFITFTIMLTITIWFVDTLIIYQHFGFKLNKLKLTDKILFNDKVIDPATIVKIEKVNIYPASVVNKWSISTIRFTLNDQTDFQILSKPHSILLVISHLFGISYSYFSDKSKAKTDKASDNKPINTYFVRELDQTLEILISKYPTLRYIY